ncbi:MAG: hypothetical protein GY943_14050 [Chloroflexi bacterium]|nr:hypothetical protein [Chloroflexota bacterium]
MTGTFGGALEARKIPAGEGLLRSETNGEVEKDGKVLIIKRIHVIHHLKTAVENRETVARVLDFHADFCPVARSIRDSIEITTKVKIEEI